MHCCACCTLVSGQVALQKHVLVFRDTLFVQVERKFVMLTLGEGGVLAAMDPHAADERVRLEQLQVDLLLYL